MPAAIFVLYMIYRVFRPMFNFIIKKISQCWKFCWNKIKTSIHDTDYGESDQVQPLLAPIFSVIDIGSSENNVSVEYLLTPYLANKKTN